MVSSVVIGFTSLGFVIYVTMVVVSVLSFDCPFQTPVSLLIRSLIAAIKSRLGKHKRAATDVTALAEGGLTVGTAPLHGLHLRAFYSALAPSWEKEYKSDVRCITRVLGMSTDPDTVRPTMNFIPEVIWDAGIRNTPLEWIYRTLISCFDFTLPHTPILIPTLQDLAYLSAKAFAHVQIQQRCIPQRGGYGFMGEDWRPGTPHMALGSLGPRSDPDLVSALLIVDNALGRDVKIPWDEYKLSPGHRLWVSHLFVYLALRDPLSNNVFRFMEFSLDPSESPSDAVIIDCLCVINLMLGMRFRTKDLMTRNKRLDHQSSLVDLSLTCSKPPDALLN